MNILEQIMQQAAQQQGGDTDDTPKKSHSLTREEVIEVLKSEHAKFAEYQSQEFVPGDIVELNEYGEKLNKWPRHDVPGIVFAVDDEFDGMFDAGRHNGASALPADVAVLTMSSSGHTVFWSFPRAFLKHSLSASN